MRVIILLMYIFTFANICQHSEAASTSTNPTLLNISADEINKRIELVLNHFDAAENGDIRGRFKVYNDQQTEKGINKILSYLDPFSDFKYFFKLTHKNLQIYNNFESLQNEVDQIDLRDDNVQIKNPDFIDHIKSAKSNLPNSQLKGLRIALDPGHMGSGEWDKKTGKFVSDGRGNIVSEGKINFITAHLLKKRLEDLGAEVIVTRNDLAPVSKINYKNFSLRPYALEALRESSLSAWFLNLIKTSSDESDLVDAFRKNYNFKKLFSENKRDDYFIFRADLDARVQMINQFHPDITIIIHFDTSDLPGKFQSINPRVNQATKAYVVGGFTLSELSTNSQRRYFINHLMDPFSWDSSLFLSQKLTYEMSKQMKIKLANDGGEGATKIFPGIFSRNLYVSRKLDPSAVAYVECLFYNDPNSFIAIQKTTKSIQVNGTNYFYSDYLDNVSRALFNGVLDFIETY